jgi:hypothetical protein
MAATDPRQNQDTHTIPSPDEHRPHDSEFAAGARSIEGVGSCQPSNRTSGFASPNKNLCPQCPANPGQEQQDQEARACLSITIAISGPANGHRRTVP